MCNVSHNNAALLHLNDTLGGAAQSHHSGVLVVKQNGIQLNQRERNGHRMLVGLLHDNGVRSGGDGVLALLSARGYAQVLLLDLSELHDDDGDDDNSEEDFQLMNPTHICQAHHLPHERF